MSYIEEGWGDIAETLGYADERQMLECLYEQEDMSISLIAKIIGYAPWTVRRRLVQHGIKLRKRGGANRTKRKLLNITDEELFVKDVSELAIKYECHEATVRAERRLRRATLNGVLSDNSDQVA